MSERTEEQIRRPKTEAHGLHARLRAGTLTQGRLRVAAYAGNEGARKLLDDCPDCPQGSPSDSCKICYGTGFWCWEVDDLEDWAIGLADPDLAPEWLIEEACEHENNIDNKSIYYPRQIGSSNMPCRPCPDCKGTDTVKCNIGPLLLAVRACCAVANLVVPLHEAPKPLTSFFPAMAPNQEVDREPIDARNLCSACMGKDPDCTNVCASFWGPRRAVKLVECWLNNPTPENVEACEKIAADDLPRLFRLLVFLVRSCGEKPQVAVKHFMAEAERGEHFEDEDALRDVVNEALLEWALEG